MIDDTPEADMHDEWVMPEAVPGFAAHFSDPMYEDPANEFAPFGSDEGSDLLYEWSERRDELTRQTSVADLLNQDAFDELVGQLEVPETSPVPIPLGQIDSAVILQSAAFTLLRLAGQIDDAGRTAALKALDILIARYDSPPELVRQRSDLASWNG